MKQFLLLTLILGSQVMARDEYNPQTDIISEKYEAGHFLIYNCVDKYWVCTREDEFNQCDEDLKEAKLSNSIDLPCATFEKFPTKQSCFQRQLFLISNNFGNRFCINESWKEKEIKN